MAELKTQPTQQSIEEFLASIEDEQKRQDCVQIVAMMRQATGDPGNVWTGNMAGFGRYRYKYASGHQGEWFITGLSPRKVNLTIYITSGFDQYEELLSRLGKHKTGKACLYIKRLSDVDPVVLNELISLSVDHMVKTNPSAEA